MRFSRPSLFLNVRGFLIKILRCSLKFIRLLRVVFFSEGVIRTRSNRMKFRLTSLEIRGKWSWKLWSLERSKNSNWLGKVFFSYLQTNYISSQNKRPTFPWIIPYALIHTQGELYLDYLMMQDVKLILPPPPLLTKQADLFPVSDTWQHKAKIYCVLRLCIAQQCSQGPYISAFLIMS